MKSYVVYLKGLYTAMLSNIVEFHPFLRRDCERDASRLLSLVEQRGLPYLMVDLPAMGKHFDKCLSTGHLTQSGIAGFRPYHRGSTIPRLFKGMWLRVFDEKGLLRVDADAVMIRSLRQLLYAAKKVKVPCSDSKTWEHVNEFFAIDREVRTPTLNWVENELRTDNLRHLHIGDGLDIYPAPLCNLDFGPDYADGPPPYMDQQLAHVTQLVADIVASTLGRFNPFEWRTKHGPGAVADQRHTQFKYDFPTWPAKLEATFPMADFGFPNYAAWARIQDDDGARDLYRDHEPPSKLIAVPKTLKGPRLIAAEPVSHQWCQQSILDFLVTRLANTPLSSAIAFRDQTRNQELALAASHTQSHATIDLSSASDRLSCWLVERIFRRNESLLVALHSTRTRWVVNTIDRKSPQYHVLRKFACMGSACTFPIQSYVFAILAVAAVLYERRITPTIRTVREVAREVQVFGDDIIVPIDSWGVLQGLLSDLGLKVNHSKTFGNGKFRESCGLDAFDGTDVTPVYTITHPDVSRPQSITSSVDTHNNFAKRGWYVVSDYVKNQVHKVRRFSFPHVPMGSGTFGWYDHNWIGNGNLLRRFNALLQRVECRVSCVESQVIRSPTAGDSQLLQYFTEVRPVKYIVGDRIGIVGRARTSIRTRWVPESMIGN